MADVSPAPLVLLYNLDDTSPKGAVLRALFEGAGVNVKTVAASELANTVGHLAGLPGFPPAPDAGATPAAPNEELVFFCHMTDDRVMELIRAMRAAGATVGCKATLTEHNRSWTFVRLMQEVAEEHAAMTRLRAQQQ